MNATRHFVRALAAAALALTASANMGRLRIRVYAENGKVYGLVPPAGTVLLFR